jgi:hypothetical protein
MIDVAVTANAEAQFNASPGWLCNRHQIGGFHPLPFLT